MLLKTLPTETYSIFSNAINSELNMLEKAVKIKVVYLVTLSLIFTAFSNIFYSVFMAFEKMEYVSVGRVLSSILMLAGTLIAINQGFGVIGFASIYFIVSAIVL